MMKTKLSLLSFLLTCSVEVLSQALTIYNPAAGYNASQLRNSNTLCVNAFGSEVFVGYREIGLLKMETATQNWTVYDTSNSDIPSNSVNVAKFDASGQLWVGTKAGLSNFSNGVWTNYNIQNSALCCDTIYSLLPVATGLWVGTHIGLSFFNGSTFTNYTTSNSGIAGNRVTCLETNGSGNIYIGTYNGFSVYNGFTWSNISAGNSTLMCDTIMNIQSVSANSCWILTFKGLAKLQQGNLMVFADSVCSPQLFEYRFGSISQIAKSGNKLFAYDNLEKKLNTIDQNDSASIFLDTINPGASIPLFSRAPMSVDLSGKLWTSYATSANPGGKITCFDENLSIGFFNNAPVFKKSYEQLDFNEVRANLNNDGSMYWDYDNGVYEVPKCSGKNALFAGALWLGGYDQNGILHASAMTYRQNNQTDFWPGPLDTLFGYPDTTAASIYNDVWKLTQETIDVFKINFLNGNVTNGTYPVPYDILTYPAVGSGNFTRNMAPFFDYNNDGNYNPYDGDYPVIKGDQQLYWIYNDNNPFQTTTNALPLQVEIHSSAYSYQCPSLTINDVNGAINYTTFYNFELYNRSNNNYDSMYVGVWIDVDLGDYDDDYVGCDTTLNIGFGYNGDNDDANGTAAGYGLNPPMINCQILKGPEPDLNDGKDNDHDGAIDEPGETNMMSGFMTYDNANGIPTGNPNASDDYYQYMSGSWLDGTPVTYGGFGYNPGSTNITPFMFPGRPYAGNGWSFLIGGFTPGDRRMLLSSGPFSLAPGQMKSLDYAIVFTRYSTASNGLNTSIARNIACTQKIKQWFDTNVLGDCSLLSVNDMDPLQDKFSLYPNPCNDKINIAANYSGNEPLQYTITDLTGRIVDQNYFSKTITVSIHDLGKAVYIVSVSNSKTIMTQKFVKY